MKYNKKEIIDKIIMNCMVPHNMIVMLGKREKQVIVLPSPANLPHSLTKDHVVFTNISREASERFVNAKNKYAVIENYLNEKSVEYEVGVCI